MGVNPTPPSRSAPPRQNPPNEGVDCKETLDMATFNLRDYWVSKFQTNPELHESQKLITDEPLVIIRIARLYQAGISDTDLYETTRRWWTGSDRMHSAQYALSVYKGVCVEVYKVHEWRRGSFNDKPKWEFDGVVADDNIRSLMLFKSVKYLFKFGAANPIKYLNC